MTMMRTKAEQKALERKLNKLSNKYEPNTKHNREYNQDMRDIEELRQAGLIDFEDAVGLAFEAKVKFEGAEEKRRSERRKAAGPCIPNRPKPKGSFLSRMIGW